MRKAAAFRGGANKTAPPCETLVANKYLVTVPVEQLQRESLTEKSALRENDFQRPAKGGSTPAFAYQRAAIAPLPCLNLQLGFIKAANSELASFKKCNCNRKNRLQNQFASQMWATRPHLGSIFEKLLHRKTFQLPAARSLQPLSMLFCQQFC